MQKIILTKGIQASGKSTWAKQFVKDSNGKVKRINRDELRLMIDVGQWSRENEKLIVKLRNQILISCIQNGYDVVIDDTNLAKNIWDDICKVINSLNKNIELTEKCFPVDVETAVFRDSQRGLQSVGEKVVRDTYKRYVKSNKDIFEPRTMIFLKKDNVKLLQDESKQKAIICDLDGTLALMGKRSPYDASECDELDKPNIPVIEAMKSFYDKGYEIIFVSGRDDKFEEPTRRFITKYLPEVEQFQLYMRPAHDMRKDSIVKKEIFEQNIYNKFNVICVFDDRNSVVKCWREEIGLTVFQVAEGDF